MPFVNLPVYSDTPKSAAPAPQPLAEPKEEEHEEDVKSSGKGGKKKGGGGGKKGGKNKGGKEEAEPATAEAEGEQQVAVIDEIWPKKDALGITKW